MKHVRLHSAEVEEALKTEPMRRLMHQHAEGAAGRAGPGYQASSEIGQNRARASVITATPEAMRDNQKHNTLLRVIRG